MSDVVSNYEHKYETKFIIDSSEEFERIDEIGISDYDRVFIVIDENVSKLYEEKLLPKMINGKQELFVHRVKPVEETKSIAYYPKLVEFFEENTAGRYDAVVAIGGGIVIDLVSFTVSTYMRGLPFFIVATTLIGQTDASTAGKTCLNSYNTKNLLGTFFYPKVVYNSIPILKTNTKRITRQGLSEAFKYSLLTDGELLGDIIKFQNSDFDSDIMEKIVEKTIQSRIKIRLVDPLASNLGHTFGHALEKYFDYQILHGDAILIGTVMAMGYGVKVGIMEQSEYDRIYDMMNEAHLNTYISKELDTKKLVELMKKDKKSSSKKLHLVMINGVGRPYRSDTPFLEADYEDVEKYLEEFMESYLHKEENYLNHIGLEEL